MRIPGERIKRTRLIQTEHYVVPVEGEIVAPADDPSKPCYESETVEFLRDVKEKAEHGDLPWLTRHGRVYAATEPACPQLTRSASSTIENYKRDGGPCRWVLEPMN